MNNELPLPRMVASENNQIIDSIASSLNTDKYPLFNLPIPLPNSNISESNATKELKKYISIDLDKSLTKKKLLKQ